MICKTSLEELLEFCSKKEIENAYTKLQAKYVSSNIVEWTHTYYINFTNENIRNKTLSISGHSMLYDFTEYLKVVD